MLSAGGVAESAVSWWCCRECCQLVVLQGVLSAGGVAGSARQKTKFMASLLEKNIVQRQRRTAGGSIDRVLLSPPLSHPCSLLVSPPLSPVLSLLLPPRSPHSFVCSVPFLLCHPLFLSCLRFCCLPLSSLNCDLGPVAWGSILVRTGGVRVVSLVRAGGFGV